MEVGKPLAKLLHGFEVQVLGHARITYLQYNNISHERAE